MHQIKIHNRTFQLPASWEEITENQAKAIIDALFVEDTTKVRMKVLMSLLGIKWKLFRKIDPAAVWEMIQLIGFVWSKPLFVCPMTQFSHKGKTYFLPDPYLTNVSIIEYAMAENHLNAFAAAKPAALDELIAAICRPLKRNLDRDDPDWDGDQREKYNAAIADKRSKELHDLPIRIKLLVLQYFISSKKYLTSQYKVLWQKSSGSTGGPKTGLQLGWMGLIYDLAEKQTFGDFEKTAFVNIHTICLYLVKNYFDNKAAEQVA